MTSRAVQRGVLAAVLILSSLGGAAPVAAAGDVEILVLSNRADLLSGGDAYVEVVLPDGVDPGDVVVDVGGRVVTGAFAVRDDGRFTGRVEGLAPGDSRLTARLPDGSGAWITLTSHPIGGPVFSGPQIQPWLCTTEAEGLGAPLDEQCNAPTRIDWFYLPEGGDALAPYDPENPAADVAQVTIDTGATVPFIVRQETGTQNRGITTVAVLFDPSQPWEPWAPQAGWNHKLFYPFGASCGTVHSQSGAQDVLDREALSRGFLVATSSMNVLGNNCNTVTSAESVMMLKEHIQERYGAIRYTFGRGGSGGSIGQHMVANNYPGLLQGLTVTSAFPDNLSTGLEVFDCHVLVQYFLTQSPHLWANAAQQAVLTGNGSSVHTCAAWEVLFSPVADPHNGCGVPAEEHYDAATNPTGCRGTYQDFSEAIYGRRPEALWSEAERAYGGFAPGPWENTGVLYGLTALQQGLIAPEQFVDLNVNVGAFDLDFARTEERAPMDPAVATLAYRAGQLIDGRQLDQVAIIDTRSTGNLDPLGIHTMHHSFALKHRLENVHGQADNHVVWRGGTPDAGAFDTMDRWLAAVEADASGAPLADRIVANRPGEAEDACFIEGQTITDEAQCDLLYPYHSSPRIVAGAPTTHDVLACALVPLDRSGDFGPIPLTESQFDLLDQAFPDGVCDYSRPSPHAVPSVPWLSYAEGPGGQPLGDAPVSTPFGPGEAPAGGLLVRHAGAGRVETAVAVSAHQHDAAQTVVIARADQFADALTGGPLAVALGAPLLLSRPDALSPATEAEVVRLGAGEAVLLGGESALGAAVAQRLAELGLTVRRIAGPNRYATAAQIAAQLPASDEVLLASGQAFPDALTASALGAGTGLPVLLAEVGRVPPETLAALDPGRDVTVVGGPAAIGEPVLAELDAAAGTARRLAGATRWATSAAVATAALARGLDPASTWIATGLDFADALVAGAAAGHDHGVLLLVDGTSLDASPETRDALAAIADRVATLHVAGGTAAVSAGVDAALLAIVG